MTRRTANLSPAQSDVLDELLCGQTNQQIADSLHLSVNTIKAHLKPILVALGAQDRTEAVVLVLSGRVDVQVTDGRGKWERVKAS